MTDWQDWEVPLAGSIDTHTDRKQVSPGNFLEIKNAEFGDSGAVTTRNGRASLGFNILTSTDELGVAHGVADYRGSKLAFDKRRAYVRSDSANAWVAVGSNGIMDSRSTIINNSVKTISRPSAAYNGGKILYAYLSDDPLSSLRHIRITLLDAADGAFVVDDRFIANSPPVSPNITLHTRVIAVGSSFVFAARESTNQIVIRRIDPNAAGAPTTIITSTLDSNLVPNAFDLVAISSTEFMFSYRNNANQIATGRFNLTAQIGAYVTVAAGATGSLGISWDAVQSRLLVAFTPAGANVSGIIYNLNLTVNVPVTVLSSGGVSSIFQVCAVWDGLSGKHTIFFDNLSSSALPIPTFDLIPTSYFIDANYSGGVFTSPGSVPIARCLSLGSKGYLSEGNVYVSLESFGPYIANAAIFPGPASIGGAFLVRMDHVSSGGGVVLSASSIITRILSGFRATNPAEGTIGDVAVYADGSGKSAIPTARVSRTDINIVSLYSTLYTTKSVKNAVSQMIGSNLYTCSSMLYQFDGHEYAEHGFHLQPIIAARGLAAGGTLPNGLYQMAVVYEYVDKNGNITRSAPTFMSVNVPGAAASSIEVQCRTVPTQKAIYSTVVYLSLVGASTLYRHSTRETVQSQSLTNLTITITAPSSTSSAVLYTTGGVTADSPLPSPDMICTHKNRLYAIVNGRDLWFSKPDIVGEGLGMSIVQSFPLSTAGGTPISLGSMDDNLIIFAELSAYALGGDGPNILGVGAFIGPQQILTDSGCDPRSPASVIKYRDGLLFRGPRNITRLGRDFSATEFRELEDLSGTPITDATLLADKNQIRLSRPPNSALIYDYTAGRWSEYLYATVGSAVSNGVYFDIIERVAGVSSIVSVETTDYRDNLVASGGSVLPITTTLATGWINLAGIQGYQRIRRFGYEVQSPTSIQVDVAYDYDDTVAETFVEATPIAEGAHSFRHRISRQRCRAIKFVFTMIRLSTISPAILSSLKLELGIIKGIYRRNG